MAEKIFKRFSTQFSPIELIASSGGVFEVTVDGELIFSKKELGRFPEDDEVETALDARK